MRFCLLTECDTRPGMTHAARYFELVDEVLLAERVGFDLFGASEQHFAIGGASVSAPEVLYPFLMALTSRIRFLHAVTLLPRNFNHPLRVAERLATEDILSHGRVELGTGRGNTPLALRAFEVSPEENKAQWDEGIELDPDGVFARSVHVRGPLLQGAAAEFDAEAGAVAAPADPCCRHEPGDPRAGGEKGIGMISFASLHRVRVHAERDQALRRHLR